MKNIISFIVCAIMVVSLVSCGDQSSGSSSTAFKIQPGDVTPITPDLTGKGTSFDVFFDGTRYYVSTDAYAIIISNVNNTGNVGIAFGTDPKSNRSFKVFIYFNSSSFPPSNGTYSGTVTVIENGKKYSDSTSNNITLNDFSDPESDKLYTIEITINNNIGGKPLNITSLKAYLIQ